MLFRPHYCCWDLIEEPLWLRALREARRSGLTRREMLKLPRVGRLFQLGRTPGPILQHKQLRFTEHTNLTKPQRIIFFMCVLYSAPSWARVFLEWTQNVVPPSKTLGINELVIPWEPKRLAFIQSARAQGYHVYIECNLEEAASLASSAASGFPPDRARSPARRGRAASACRATQPRR